MIKFTKFTHEETVGKIIGINQQTGQYEKLTVGNLKAATLQTISLNNISEFPTYLAALNGFNHSTAGISPINATMAIKGPVNYQNGVINRSNKDLPWPESDASLFFVDDDDCGGKFTYIPALKDFACVRYTSSGSMIYSADGATEYSGFNGCHTVFAVKNGKKTKKALERLHQREILNYRGQCKVSQAGTFLERSCFDRMMGSSSQPAYHKATLLNGLQQKQIIEFVPGILEPIDLDKLVPPLTKEEKDAYELAIKYEQMKLKPEMERVRQEWINNQVNSGVNKENAVRALDKHELEYDVVIHTSQGAVTVKEILADRKRWNGITCRDPIEPDYGSSTVAKIYSMQAHPMINSNAHGGVTYALYDASSVGFGAEVPATLDNVTGEPVELTVQNVTIPQDAVYSMSNPITGMDWTANQVNSKMEPFSTIDNFKRLMKLYGVGVAYDLIAKDIMMVGQKMTVQGDLKDAANLSEIKSVCILNKFQTGIIPDYLTSMMNENQINPVKEWITDQVWDGEDHLRELFNTLTLAPDQDAEIAWLMFRKWFIGACRIGTGVINKFEFVLCLQAVGGGEGKTRWFNKLCPDAWQVDGLIFDPNKTDDIKKAISFWLVELGELDSTFRGDIKKLMAFLTNHEDMIRLPYAAKHAKFGRRTAFFGSVNKKNFLVDDSGDRRIWPISVTGINYQHDIDMQQLWAQVHAIPMSETHWLDKAENDLIINANKDFKAPCLVDDILSSYFGGEKLTKMSGFDPMGRPILAPVAMEHLNATELLNKAGIERPTQSQLIKVGPWLKQNDFDRIKRNGKGGYLVTVMKDY